MSLVKELCDEICDNYYLEGLPKKELEQIVKEKLTIVFELFAYKDEEGWKAGIIGDFPVNEEYRIVFGDNECAENGENNHGI